MEDDPSPVSLLTNHMFFHSGQQCSGSPQYTTFLYLQEKKLHWTGRQTDLANQLLNPTSHMHVIPVKCISSMFSNVVILTRRHHHRETPYLRGQISSGVARVQWLLGHLVGISPPHSRRVWGHGGPENFEILGALRCILGPSEAYYLALAWRPSQPFKSGHDLSACWHPHSQKTRKEYVAFL